MTMRDNELSEAISNIDKHFFKMLKKYIDRKDKTSGENYTTVLFTEVLKRYPELLNKFIIRLLGSSNDLKSKIIINTFVPHDSIGITDLEIQIDDRLIILEIKVDSPLYSRDGTPQIVWYDDISLPKSIYLLSRFPIDISSNKEKMKDYSGNILWHDIYLMGKEIIKDNHHEQFYFLNDFLNFMEDIDLDPPHPITENDLKVWTDLDQLKNRITRIWKRIIPELKTEFDLKLSSRDWSHGSYYHIQRCYFHGLRLDLQLNFGSVLIRNS